MVPHPVLPRLVLPLPVRPEPCQREQSMRDVTKFNTLTFDCYGTLIDWERDLISGIRPVLERHGPVNPLKASAEKAATIAQTVERL